MFLFFCLVLETLKTATVNHAEADAGRDRTEQHDWTQQHLDFGHVALVQLTFARKSSAGYNETDIDTSTFWHFSIYVLRHAAYWRANQLENYQQLWNVICKCLKLERHRYWGDTPKNGTMCCGVLEVIYSVKCLIIFLYAIKLLRKYIILFCWFNWNNHLKKQHFDVLKHIQSKHKFGIEILKKSNPVRLVCWSRMAYGL